jgi:hypothetical protein
MQIKKIYRNVLPELLFDELKDLALKQGLVPGESRMNTYSLPEDSSSFIYRGLMSFKNPKKKGEADPECLRAHIQGAAKGETKLMLDINEELFGQEKVAALQGDMDFLFGSNEVKRA